MKSINIGMIIYIPLLNKNPPLDIYCTARIKPPSWYNSKFESKILYDIMSLMNKNDLSNIFSFVNLYIVLLIWLTLWMNNLLSDILFELWIKLMLWYNFSSWIWKSIWHNINYDYIHLDIMNFLNMNNLLNDIYFLIEFIPDLIYIGVLNKSFAWYYISVLNKNK